MTAPTPRLASAVIARDQLARWAVELEGRSAGDILAAVADRFAPRLTFATGFGMEGCVLIDLIARGSLPIDIFTLDTGLLFPETYAVWRRLESRYGIVIRAVRPERTVQEQAAGEGPELWSRDPDRCCELRKIRPQRLALAPFDAWISAVRRDQTPDRAEAPVIGWDGRFGLARVNPLVRWTTEDVREYVREHDVPINLLHDRGYPSIGCLPCTSPVAFGEDPRAGRWRGFEKTECGLHLNPSAAAAPHDKATAGESSDACDAKDAK
jgi:phosphoadenylyl-sulfate reductase (thioredoxin)